MAFIMPPQVQEDPAFKADTKAKGMHESWSTGTHSFLPTRQTHTLPGPPDRHTLFLAHLLHDVLTILSWTSLKFQGDCRCLSNVKETTDAAVTTPESFKSAERFVGLCHGVVLIVDSPLWCSLLHVLCSGLLFGLLLPCLCTLVQVLLTTRQFSLKSLANLEFKTHQVIDLL